MCTWMQAFGKLWSASPSFPRGSLLMDQSSTNPAHQIARLATEVLVVLGVDSSLLSSAFLVVWKIACGTCWIQLLVISLLPSWYSSFNKHVFLSLCNLLTVQLFLDFSMKEWGKRCGHANMCSEAKNKMIFDECLVTRNVSWCGGRP